MSRAPGIMTLIGVALLAALATGVGVYYYTQKQAHVGNSIVVPIDTRSPSLPLPVEKFTLYYYSPEDGVLVPEEREIETPKNLEERIIAVLGELVKDPKEPNRTCPIAAEFALRAVYIDPKEQRAYLDLAGPLVPEATSAGTLEAWAAIHACVNTVCGLSDQIKEVQFLENGQPITQPLAGWDLSQPFAPETAFVRYETAAP